NQPLSRRDDDAVVVRHHESLRLGEDSAAPSYAGGRAPLSQEEANIGHGSAVSGDDAVLQGGEGFTPRKSRGEVRPFQVPGSGFRRSPVARRPSRAASAAFPFRSRSTASGIIRGNRSPA